MARIPRFRVARSTLGTAVGVAGITKRLLFAGSKPKRSLRTAKPHERLDELKPGVNIFGRILRPLVVVAFALTVWLSQLWFGGSGWFIAFLVGFGIVWTHFVTFKGWLVISDAPYDDRWRFWPRQILRRRAVEIVMLLVAVLVAAMDILGLHDIANWLTPIGLLAGIIGGFNLGRWYVRDVRERYELLSEYLVERLEHLPGSDEIRAVLSSAFGPSNLPNLQALAESMFMTITDYTLTSPSDRSALFSPVDSRDLELLHAGANRLGKPVYEFWVENEWVENDEEDSHLFPERIEKVTVYRNPVDPGKLTAADREKYGRALIAVYPKASNGWRIEDAQDSQTLVLHYGKPLALPGIVRMSEVVTGYDPTLWNRIDIGKDAEGQLRGIDLIAGPHSLVVGPTGSGKTMVLLMIAAQAMARGHEVIVVDPMKSAVDFAPVRSRLKMTVTTESDAAQVLVRVYAEVKRRKDLLVAGDKGRWDRLPEDVREREGIRPITVVVDEYTSLILPLEMSKELAKQLPAEDVEEIEEANAAKAIIRNYIGKLAREARFVGVHLAIAAQRPDAAIFGGEFRAQLSSAILAVAPSQPPKPETSRMVFPDASTEIAQIVQDLDSGIPGLAIIGAEGGTVSGIRVGFSPDDEIDPFLTSIGIPPAPDPWTLDAQFDAQAKVAQLSTDSTPVAASVDSAAKDEAFKVQKPSPFDRWR
jgi:hypothetical protein